eukprot:CAMPEP_0118878822 /NCGR_PEP_ID=MMETSP1163-20130328/18696_1 /TAXON_ID=124430 /ORGANISM="Phaeomonas parva, Strain CCMP2877" /LENGTH=358 /DNA_ID=CAMNT_0006814769 /DNA_START=68 /DNA_END=1144 /DNA_ORIENTATION=-
MSDSKAKLLERYGSKKRKRKAASAMVQDADLGWDAVEAGDAEAAAAGDALVGIVGDAPVIVGDVQEAEEAAASRGGGGGGDSSSDDAAARRRRRYDSDAASESSSDDSDSDDSDAGVRRRRTPNLNPRVVAAKEEASDDSSGEDSDDSDAGVRRRPKMSSGHRAGLHTGAEFQEREAKLQEQKAAKLKAMGDEASGKNAETVYRDKKGRKLDMLTEFMRQQDVRDGKEAQEAQEQYEWGRGTKQKEDDEAYAQELENIKNEPFARRADDARLEASRKEELRADDPMLAYMQKKRAEGKAAGRPQYAGPPAPPNRFGIKPGYRWDGVDRGTGFEARLLAKDSKDKIARERSYRSRAADM